MEQGELEGVDALAQEIEEEKSCEEEGHQVDAEEPEPAAPLPEEPIFEPQQYFDTEPLTPEAKIEVEIIEENETEPNRKPILLGMAPLVNEETIEPSAPASSRGEVRSMAPIPAFYRGRLHSMTASPSSFISSLHRSDVMRSGRMSGRGSRRGSDMNASGANGYERNSHSVVGRAMERNSSEVLMGRESIMLSSWEGWEADDLGRRARW